jgi:hypothetical protein
MTVFLTPEGKPFFGGTYYPPEPRHGMPSFGQVLDAIAQAWAERREGVLAQSEEVTEHIARTARLGAPDDDPDAAILEEAARGMLAQLDDEWGGFGEAPKFPQPMTLEFLLRMHLRGVSGALPAVTLTLDRMARGGIFDQIGGGFHRYSTDRVWLVPHFEKMLYDNGQLLRLYTRAWQVTGTPLYRDTALATAEYLLREMRHRDGGFFASQDADTEGVEGRFYVWPYDELTGAAGDDTAVGIAAFAVAGTGNWEGVNVLSRPDPVERIAEETAVPVEEVRAAIERVRAALYRAREARPRPATDDKVLASWNGMAICGLAEAGRVFGRPDLVEAAARAGTFLLDALVVDGRLQRSWRQGRTSGPGFLDDHAMLADAFLTLYETTFDVSWWDAALRLADAMRALFGDEHGFFDTGSDADPTVIRPKDIFDNAVPSGNAAASDVLLRLAAFTGDDAFEGQAMAFLRTIAPVMRRAPLGFGTALSALDRALSPRLEVAVVGPVVDAGTVALATQAVLPYLPNRVLAVAGAGSHGPPLLTGRSVVNGRPAAYVCRNFACDAPVTDPDALARLLQTG